MTEERTWCWNGHRLFSVQTDQTAAPSDAPLLYLSQVTALLERAEELLAKWEGSSKRNDDVLVFEALDLLRSLLDPVATQEENKR